ncbi:MAG: type II toxin-antitoxin system VapC family toxin [Acidobacteriaceae bacterium]|nr:type II toxin-antitoxin system VapC family toxin [Acidobacteriaceae bacterium]
MSGPFVLDASLAVSWCFRDEITPLGAHVLAKLETVHAIAPAVLAFELANGLTLAQRRRRITLAEQQECLEKLRQLPIALEQRPLFWLCERIIPLAHKFRLTAYDAAYLELAIREALPLATLDGDLRQAALQAGIPLVA